MKKSLIMLAVLASSSAAMADVSITGRLDAGYLAKNGSNGSNTSGLGVDKSEIYFNAKEDLGAGQSVQAQLGVGGLDRSEVTDPKGGTQSGVAVTGRDSFIAYTNNALGRIEVGNTTAKNYFAGIASAGSPTIDFDGKLYEIRTANDYASYYLPIGPVTLIATHNESSRGLGVGIGDQYNQGSQNNNTLLALYKQGPLTAALSYRAYNAQITNVAQTYLGTRNNVVNAQANYDFGFAKIGGGYQRTKGSSGVQVDDYLVGASVPVGALTLGGAFAGSRASNIPAGSALPGWDFSKYAGTKTGYSLGASYALSKTTAVIAKFAAWKYSGYEQFQKDALAGGGNGSAGLTDGIATERSIVLSHNF